MVNTVKNVFDRTKQSATDAFKTLLKRAIQKTVEATGGLIGNKVADKIAKTSKTSKQNNPETVTNEHDKEILKGRYISPEETETFCLI